MTVRVEADLVAAAVEAAREQGKDVAEVPLTAIAAAAGISRSTLLRRIGGSRTALDQAVRDAGVDPGARRSVRERAIEAAAWLIGEHGLGAVTLDAVAEAAGCSVPSLHATFGRRDGLLTAIFERYGPVLDLEALAADPPERLEDTVRAVHSAVIAAFGNEPRVLPAVFADVFSRPDGPGSQLMKQGNFARIVQSVSALLLPYVQTGRIRPMSIVALAQLLVGPLVTHLLLRPVVASVLGPELPDVDEIREEFAEAFLRAVTVPKGTARKK